MPEFTETPRQAKRRNVQPLQLPELISPILVGAALDQIEESLLANLFLDLATEKEADFLNSLVGQYL